MSLLIAWFLFPLALAFLTLGCGLLLQELSGVRTPPPLLVPSGFAFVIVISLFATSLAATATLATPLVCACAVAGLVLSLPWRRCRVSLYAGVSAVASFAAFGLPVLASGRATFAGYIKLDDTATWFAITDRVMTHGRSLAGLGPSSYSVVLNDYLGNGYPVGSFLPLGVGRVIVRQDVAWVFEPYMAFTGGVLALVLYALTRQIVRSRLLRAVTAFIASQPALLYAYTLWGGVKEIVSATLLALVAAQLPSLWRAPGTIRAVVPLAVTSAAVVGALSAGGVIWLLPLLLPASILLARERGQAMTLRRAGAYCVCAVVLAVPALAISGTFVSQASATSVLTKRSELGNLLHPLSKLEVSGIWPTGDFRGSPARMDATAVMILALALGAVVAVTCGWRRRAPEFLLYGLGAAAGCAVIVMFGSPWVAAKALATASPAVLLFGIAGAAVVYGGGRRVEGGLLGAAIATGVLWSNALAYADVTLAPRGQFTELARIDQRFRAEGPTLINEFSPYGSRHFLRDMDPESPSERRFRPVTLRTGSVLQPGTSADTDDFQLSALLPYRTLVLRRSGSSSRPPSIYRLVWAGRYYQVWQRPDSAPATIIDHLSLGTRYQPAAIPSCDDVIRLAREAGASGSLAFVERSTPNAVIELSATPYASTTQYNEDARVVYLRRNSNLRYRFTALVTGDYSIWVGGSFLARLSLSIDGKRVAARRHDFNWPGQFSPFGDARLTPGAHELNLSYSGSDIHPGSAGDPPFGAGPIVLSREADLPVRYVAPQNARALCGKRLDWVEAIRR